MKWLAANRCNTFLRACLGCRPCFPEWGSVSLLGCQGLKRYSCLNWKAEVMRRLGPNSHYMRHSPQDKSKNTTSGKTPLDNRSCGFVQRVHALCTFDDLPQVRRLSKCQLTLCDCGVDYNYHTCGLHSFEHLELFLRLMHEGLNFFFFPCFSISEFCSNSTCPKLRFRLLTLLTYQVWTGISASGTSSPGPSAAPRWRWCGCVAASSGAACCAPSPTRCLCWGASDSARARSIAGAAVTARASARPLGRHLGTPPEGGGGVAAWSLRGGGRHVATRSLGEQTEANEQ